MMDYYLFDFILFFFPFFFKNTLILFISQSNNNLLGDWDENLK